MPRYVHRTDLTALNGLEEFRQGLRQAKAMLGRYHYLRAAVMELYDIREEAPDPSQPWQISPRQGMYFDRYTDFALESFIGMKLHPREDGTIHPEDLEQYKKELLLNWKTREAGIMYAVGTGRPFWNMILNFNSPAHTTGINAWDEFLSQWKQTGCPKEMLPCMFFARLSGCLDASCPYEHDPVTTRADREVVLGYRRAECGRLTSEDIARYGPNAGDPVAISPSDDGFLVKHIRNCIVNPPRPVCWNVVCPNVGQISTAADLKICSRCRVATYCSAACQRATWKNHKSDCHPFEKIVEDDELWLEQGVRVGTDKNGVTWSKDGMTIPGGAQWRGPGGPAMLA